MVVATIILRREETVGAIRHQVARDAEREAMAVGQHNSPFDNPESDDFGGAISSGDGAPVLVDGCPHKVCRIKGDGEGTPGVQDDGNGGRVVSVALGAKARNKFGIESWEGGLEAGGQKRGGS